VPGSTLPATHSTASILQRPYLWVTIGTCALVFLAAFESLAVTTSPLVPRGTLLARRGLPSVIAARGPASAAFTACVAPRVTSPRSS